MKISVAIEDNVKAVLQEAKKQFINVSIQNGSGIWSKEYFNIQEVSVINQGEEKITIVVLCSPNDSTYTAINVKFIHGVKFDKYLLLGGDLYDEMKVVSKDTALQATH